MSYYNGYSNGNYGTNRYDDSQNNESSVGPGSRTRRPGGYGGFYDGPPASTSPEPQRQPSIASFRRRREEDSGGGFGHFASGRRDTDDIGSSRSRDRILHGKDASRLHGSGPGGKQIDDVLAHVNDNWEVMTREDCVPVHVALQLLDYSSLGRGNDYQDFQRTSRYLQKALKSIVNEHHQGFNSSIGTFHKIQTSIQASQSRVRTLRDSIKGAKTDLMVTKPELKALGSSSQHYDDMLQKLGQIEKLQLMPEQLDARISDKHFLAAVDIMQDALRIVRRADMEKIGALTDLRIYFSNQETSLTDILIEELHDHLYLKSPYCHDRWKPYNSDAGALGKSGSNENSAPPSTWGRPLYRFLDNLDTSKPMEDDASRNPEVDSFQYIQTVIESLHKLGNLDIAVDRLEERLPIELFAIVDRTNQEVDMRHGNALRRPRKLDERLAGASFDGSSGRNDVLNDLLWTLYSKFEAIAEGHRAVHEVVKGIIKRDDLAKTDNLTRGFKEMWKLYQSEMRSILHDYLAAEASQAYRQRGQAPVNGSIFQTNPRERNKRMFKLAEVDQKSPELASDQRDLDQILETCVPGLVSKVQRKSGIVTNPLGPGQDKPVAGHKLLVEANVFNIGSLLPPTLSFLQRLKDIVPHDAGIALSTLTTFLDEFLVNVFHPSLEDTVTELCTQAFSELDAFQKDPQWSQHSRKPIFKGTYTFFTLIESFCQLLDTIPPDLTSTQLIITQILAYYDKCCEWYRALVRKPQLQPQDEIKLKPAAAMADSGEILAVCQRLLRGENDDPRAHPLIDETRLILNKTSEEPPEPFDIISDGRTVTILCLIFNSMQWLASRLQDLRRIVPEVSHKRGDSRKSLNRHLSLITGPTSINESTQAYLPMNSETVAAFDNLLDSIRALATTALMTLHSDIRLGIIHMLTRTISANYLLAQPAQDPDPSILSLNSDLMSTVDTLSTHIPENSQTFIVTGLALLIDTFLVQNAAKIQDGMNLHGCGRMQLNILVLSQNLKSITSSSKDDNLELVRSGAYYDLFLEGADSIASRAKDQGGAGLEAFDLEELKTLVELWYRDDTRSTVREVQVKSQRDLSDHLLVLSECLWNR